MVRSIRFKEMVFWPCGDGLELYCGPPDSAGECAAQDGKNGRGQPSSFLVLSQIFTQSSMHENPPLETAYCDPACNLGEGNDCIKTPGLL